MCCRTNLLLTLISISIFPFFTIGALQPQHQHVHGGGCILAERAALLSFKEGITSNNTNLLASWQGQDCCRWRGVSCSNRTGHVIKRHLHNPNVALDTYGNYHACGGVSALFGEISPSLLSLKRLEHLDLSWNCLLGTNSQIPHFLGSMGNLRYLNLSGMPFIGRVPSQLGNLSKLQYLDLGQDGEYSDMYSKDITWLTKLPYLKFLSMSRVSLSGIADWPHTLNMIPSLRVIDLHQCLLDSANQSLPHLNLTKLEKLDLSSNYFEHSLGFGWFWKATSLKYLNLRGNLLFGQFPDTLGNMSYLQVLNISWNENPDMLMAGNLENLCSLETIDLSRNGITGDIAMFLESLPQCTRQKMQKLDLSYNNFTGTLPSLISDFTGLSILSLSSNSLVGSIPPQIGNLTCLTSLELSKNLLTGSIPPELMHSTSLTHLDLSSNHLNGSVPTEIGSLTNLISLNLRDNSFTCVITEAHFANLTSLNGIDLSSNNLKIELNSDWRPPSTLEFVSFASCQLGPLFPPWLQHILPPLETTTLDISNKSLKGEFPDWFWSTFSHATYLDISNNQIGGSLPAHLHGMAFKELYLSSNQLTGPIPMLPTNITRLDISNNRFSETIPTKLGASRLQVLCMHSNQIGGYIPESICKMKQLVYLDLSNNILEGEIPQCSLFDMGQIEFLILSNNSLSGKIPEFLSTTWLKFLDLSWNKFSGGLPTWIGKLVKIRFLILSHNKFSGNIPDMTYVRYLQYLDLSSNNLSGAIPWHLSNLIRMTTLQEESMDIVLSEPTSETTGYWIKIGMDRLGHILLVNTKGQQLTYHRTIAYFVSIDLSCNSLTGEIPTYVTSLAALMNLNLSSNQLSGKIPNRIGAMQSLESLDLSWNKLSGEIPSSLSSLTSLSYLNLSYNSLSGRIPSGPQLDTLNAEKSSLMYIGNSGLCGPPVHKNCSGNDPSIRGDLESSKQEFEPLTFYFGLVVGLVVGLWIVFCALLFKKTWRIAYFCLFDKVYDLVYVFVVVKWASFAKNTTVE